MKKYNEMNTLERLGCDALTALVSWLIAMLPIFIIGCIEKNQNKKALRSEAQYDEEEDLD